MNATLRRFLLWLMIFSVIAFVPSLAQEEEKADEKKERKAPGLISVIDILRINRVGSPQISPDGMWLLYTKSVRDMEDKDMGTTTHIWRVRPDGTYRRQMTYGEESCSSPEWFPSGKKIAFVTSRKGTLPAGEGASNAQGPKRQVFFMYADGGEAWQATNHMESVQSFEISPDGKRILFTSQDSLTKEEEKKRKEKDDAEVVDEKFRMSHLWVFDIESGKEERLTEGAFTVGDAHWSPDSKRIVFVSRPNTKVDDSWNTDIWTVDLEAKTPKKLYENPGSDTSPRFSPDGRFIAFASKPYTKTNTWYNNLYIIPADGGKPRVLLEDFDLDFGAPIWSSDGKTIYWNATEKTLRNLFAVDLASAKVSRMEPPRGSNSGFVLSKDGKTWVWSYAKPDRPGELMAAGADLQNPVQITDANPWLREEKMRLTTAETIRWKNSDGQWIEGVLTKPLDYMEGQKYPLILNPHGGPSSSVIESFNPTNQLFAANGFFVLQPNFRGSSSYGQEFLNANRGQWGFRDYDDCMTGVDYCIDEGWADPDKLICYGWSYGGYMSFWIVTQTDRFKAVSPGAGLPNLYSMYSTTDIPNYLGWFFGTPWDAEELYEKHSPIRYVKQVKSPVLIMHGANDARVPQEQAVEFYQALKDLGKDVTFVRYPREGHGLREPRHQIDRFRRYIFFFCEHVGIEPVTEEGEIKK